MPKNYVWAAWVASSSQNHRDPNRSERASGHRLTENLEHAFWGQDPSPGDRPICGSNVGEKGMELYTGKGYLRRCKRCIEALGADRDEPITWPAKNGNGWLLAVPYHREFLEEMKREVPNEGRTYFKDSRRWWLDSDHVDTVKRLAEKHFDSVAWPCRKSGAA